MTPADLARVTDSDPQMWDTCPWCDSFDRTDPRHRGVSHGMCERCRTRIQRELDAKEASA